MTVTDAQRLEIRLISDRDLYGDAERFLAEHGAVERNQVEGLQDYARSLDELEGFVKHQAARDWPLRKEHYGDFFRALGQYLQALRRRVSDEYHLVPEGLTKKQAKEQGDLIAALLAQEFVQHLAAELLYKGNYAKIVGLRDSRERE